MSDSVTKFFDMVGDGYIPKQPAPRKIISEGHKQEAYTILANHSEEAILEAARILSVK